MVIGGAATLRPWAANFTLYVFQHWLFTFCLTGVAVIAYILSAVFRFN
jgi:hypothetical protein